MKPKFISDVTIKYFYRFICQEKTIYTNGKVLTGNVKAQIIDFCLSLKEKLNLRVKLSNLSEPPCEIIPVSSLYPFQKLKKNIILTSRLA